VDPLAVRRRFSRRLIGQGVEIGPGHVPFPVPKRVNVRYVDRWEPTENRSLFPELGESPGFPQPDVISDLDVDRLSGLADQSQDFVIASHVIEHLANPLAMLVDIHRVLRTGGLLVLLVPDRHRTFDRHRDPTPLLHLVDEYQRDVRVVDDAHITEYVIATREHGEDASDQNQFVDDLTAENLAIHRRRSVHAHVWDVDEFQQVLDYVSDELQLSWTVIDTMTPGEDGTYGDEFGWLLAREDRDSDSTRVRRWRRLARWDWRWQARRVFPASR
jgi:predicted SAM-dependent methyltransferase